MSRIMYDAVTPNNIPANAQMVAGYVNGPYAWKDSDWTRFPNAVHVTIATHPSNTDSQVIDYEKGDFDDTNLIAAIRSRRGANDTTVDNSPPTVYCSESSWAHVRGLVENAQIKQPVYWVAAYPGAGPSVPAGAVAHQYTDTGKVDISIVNDYWPGVDKIMTDPVQDNTPDFQQLIGRVASILLMTDTVGEAFNAAPIPSEQNALKEILVGLQNQITTIQATVAKLSSPTLSGTATVTIPLSQG